MEYPSQCVAHACHPVTLTVLAGLLLATPAWAQSEASDPCRQLAVANKWASAASCLAQRPAVAGGVCGDSDLELRARVFEQDGRFEAAAAAWAKAALLCKDEAQLVRTRRSNALAQLELAIDLLLANRRPQAAVALQAARRDFELQQEQLASTVPQGLKFLQNLAVTGKGAIVRRSGGDVPEAIVQVLRSPDGGAWLLTQADYGPVGGKLRLRKLDVAMRERRLLTAGNQGDDRPVQFDIESGGQLAVVGTTRDRDGKDSGWLCRPPLHSGGTTFLPLPADVTPRRVAQHAGFVWVAGLDASQKPVLLQLDPTGKELLRTATSVFAFVRVNKDLIAVSQSGDTLVITAKGVLRPSKKRLRLPPLPVATEITGQGGVWRASVDKVDDASIVVVALIR
ncbi:MAG: hypothetical protein EXR77_17725 [Myxococcales bacterium]|nr:hypothetical protein [Myxococcales bacterium]